MALENKVLLLGKGYNLKSSGTVDDRSAVNFDLTVKEKLGQTDKVSHFKINAYAGLADNVAKYWEEGKRFYIEGRMDQYFSNDGEDKIAIDAIQIKFV